jgi:hypothetical protein
MPKIRPYSSQSCTTKFRFSHSEKRRSLVGGRSVPLIPSIVERVRSGPERSRVCRFLARRSATLDGEDRCETITKDGALFPFCSSTTELEFPVLFETLLRSG